MITLCLWTNPELADEEDEADKCHGWIAVYIAPVYRNVSVLWKRFSNIGFSIVCKRIYKVKQWFDGLVEHVCIATK